MQTQTYTRNLLPGTYYRVTTDAPEGAQATSYTSLEDFARMLPHGSGLDGSFFVSIRPRGKGLSIKTEWHVMNGDRYYVGWYPVRITLERDSTGRLSVASVRINARATLDAGDYLADLFSDVCRQANGEE